MGNKRCKLNGDMAFTFKKLIESLEKIETLKLELEREVIETTKSIAQSMIVTKEGFRKESRKQILQLAQILTTKFKVRCPLMFKKIDKRFTSILCMNTIFIQSATIA